MRIALFSWETLHSIPVGGIGVHVTELAAGLERRGHEVHVFTRRGADQSNYDCIHGVHYHRCDFELHENFIDEINNMCRSFVAAFEGVARLATAAAAEGRLEPKVVTPLIDLGKAEIIRLGLDLGVDYGLTHSCYDPTPAGLACGHCDACRHRLQGFAEVGVADPVGYVE